MEKVMIPGKNGYDIPCLRNFTGKERVIVILSHGFSGSKESPPAYDFAEIMPELGIGSCSYDFPAQGDSLADGTMLRIENCINDLASVEDYVRQQAPNAEIAYFSTSFGAYITLIYFSKMQYSGKKAILLSAAINMPNLLFDRTSQEEFQELKRQGYSVMQHNYPRPMKLSWGLYQDLDAHNLFEVYKPGQAQIHMIHGDKDELVPLKIANEFAHKFSAELTVIPEADHFFRDRGSLEQVLNIAKRFY
ncbi:MAG: alpha/beta hydrolase [Anaerovoracaceae bacterium]|jgi:alpha/beta superfamily hydrolase